MMNTATNSRDIEKVKQTGHKCWAEVERKENSKGETLGFCLIVKNGCNDGS